MIITRFALSFTGLPHARSDGTKKKILIIIIIHSRRTVTRISYRAFYTRADPTVVESNTIKIIGKLHEYTMIYYCHCRRIKRSGICPNEF